MNGKTVEGVEKNNFNYSLEIGKVHCFFDKVKVASVD